jgi:hypothetical protein
MLDNNEITSAPSQMVEVKSENELEKRACAVVIGSIQKAMRLTDKGVLINKQPMIRGLTSWHKFIDTTGGHEAIFDPQLGVISNDVIFTTTRDGWAKLNTYPYGTLTQNGLPSVTGYEKEGKRYIAIEKNDSGGEFEYYALQSGAIQVRLYNTGEIKIIDDWKNGERSACVEELNEIIEIFSGIGEKLINI